MSLPTSGSLNAIILGATGATGSELLKELLARKAFNSIYEVGRRTTPLEGLTGTEKLTQKSIDLEKLDEAGLKDKKWDVVFITYGTTL
jgi:oxidoreductase